MFYIWVDFPLLKFCVPISRPLLVFIYRPLLVLCIVLLWNLYKLCFHKKKLCTSWYGFWRNETFDQIRFVSMATSNLSLLFGDNDEVRFQIYIISMKYHSFDFSFNTLYITFCCFRKKYIEVCTCIWIATSHVLI